MKNMWGRRPHTFFTLFLSGPTVALLLRNLGPRTTSRHYCVTLGKPLIHKKTHLGGYRTCVDGGSVVFVLGFCGYRCVRHDRRPIPCWVIRFGSMNVTKPFRLIGMSPRCPEPTNSKTWNRRKLNLAVWPTTGMAQTGRLIHRYGTFRVCAIQVGLIAACGVALRPKGSN